MKKLSVMIGVLLALCFNSLFANVTIKENMELTPHPYLTKLKSKPVSLDPKDFMIAALIASGVEDSAIKGYLQKVEDIYQGYEEYRVTKNVKLNDAEAAIVYLYDKKILVEYLSGQTYVDKLLDTGYYNCVSSAVLYMYIMKRRGYKVIGNETTGHVFITVKDKNGKTTDVETTNAFGYAPGVRKNFKNSDGDAGSTSVVKNDYDDRAYISGRRLIGSIIKNTMIFETENEKPNCEYILQLAINDAELQQDSKDGLQDMYTYAGNVLYYLSKENRLNDMLYVSKAVNDKYGKHGKSKLVTTNTNYALSILFNQNQNLDYQTKMLDTYGACLKTADYNYYYERIVINKAIQLYNAGQIQQAKNEILKALEVLKDSTVLKDFLDKNFK